MDAQSKVTRRDFLKITSLAAIGSSSLDLLENKVSSAKTEDNSKNPDSDKSNKLQKALQDITHAAQQLHLRIWLNHENNYHQICLMAGPSDKYVLVTLNSDKTTSTEIQYFPTISKMSTVIKKLAEKDTAYVFTYLTPNTSKQV